MTKKRKMTRKKKTKALKTRIIKKQVVSNIKHPLCLGDGVDSCGYFSTVECSECKFNNDIKYGKDPRSKNHKLV